MDLSGAKQIVKDSDVNEWKHWGEPDTWTNQQREMTIEAVRPFSEGDIGEFYGDWASRSFDNPDVKLGGIRLKYRGVPYYEGDIIYIGQQTWRAYIPLPTGTDADEKSRLSEFGYELGKKMTEPASNKDFDEVLDIGDIEAQ
ncbi:hypothetical protein [Halosimplex sp. TS25]|uniref:hypothetical protein n=1 Tax=Halosimplex rarum TaxID=3396619 RepID=UPI0039E9F025